MQGACGRAGANSQTELKSPRRQSTGPTHSDVSSECPSSQPRNSCCPKTEELDLELGPKKTASSASPHRGDTVTGWMAATNHLTPVPRSWETHTEHSGMKGLISETHVQALGREGTETGKRGRKQGGKEGCA